MTLLMFKIYIEIHQQYEFAKIANNLEQEFANFHITPNCINVRKQSIYKFNDIVNV